jgi:DNA-binding protein
MNDEDKSPVPVSNADEVSFRLKGYIENKNIPTSKFDQYVLGIKKKSDLNTNVKVPIEIYCYNDNLIHLMEQKAPAIYKNMSLTSIISDMLSRNSIHDFDIDPLTNQNRYNQVLIPNLNMLETIGFFDRIYGMYRKGAQIYGDLDKLHICNSDVINGKNPIPIYVDSSKDNSDMSGMRDINKKYQMVTMAGNVSVKTETDIERVLNARHIADINLNDMEAHTEELTDLYATTAKYAKLKNIETPNILHKSVNEYVASSYVARLNENITEVDVSGAGFDIARMKVDTRYNLVFATPIRGLNINKIYRASYVCHVLSNLDSNLFMAQTTMNLRTN